MERAEKSTRMPWYNRGPVTIWEAHVEEGVLKFIDWTPAQKDDTLDVIIMRTMGYCKSWTSAVMMWPCQMVQYK